MPETSPRTGLPPAYVRPCLLLLLADGPSHGYELLEQVRGIGVPSADTGGLYRCLRSLEQEGLVRSWWESSPSGPARRTYEISVEGHDALRELMAQISETRAALDRLLDRYVVGSVGQAT